MAETEDIPYTSVDDFATDDDNKQAEDPDRPRKGVLEALVKEIAADIRTELSFDSLSIPANAKPEDKIAAFDEIAIHKGVAMYLQKYRAMIDNKIKEL